MRFLNCCCHLKIVKYLFSSYLVFVRQQFLYKFLGFLFPRHAKFLNRCCHQKVKEYLSSIFLVFVRQRFFYKFFIRVVSPKAREVLKSLLSPKSREISCSDMEIILKENVKIKWTKKWNVFGIDVAETEYLKSESDQVVRWWSSNRIVDPSRWVVVMYRVFPRLFQIAI